MLVRLALLMSGLWILAVGLGSLLNDGAQCSMIKHQLEQVIKSILPALLNASAAGAADVGSLSPGRWHELHHGAQCSVEYQVDLQHICVACPAR